MPLRLAKVDKPRSLRYSSEVLHFQRFVGKVRGFWAAGAASIANSPIGLAAFHELSADSNHAPKPAFAARCIVSCTGETWR